jgi:Phosphotransferase enzyme family
MPGEIVESQEQFEPDICRVIVLGRDGTEVLLKTAEPGFAFPALRIPRWERLAENLTAALKRDWGCDTICLFTPNHSSADGHSEDEHYEVMECWRAGGRKDETIWKPIRALTADSFQRPADFRMFEHSLRELHGFAHDPSSPFARSGWLPSLRDWTADVIRPFGLELTGPMRQYNASPSFSLMRFETSGPAVWFKAVGEPNVREFPITLRLAQIFPRFIPEILGTRPEWNGWLSREVDGTSLGETKDTCFWEQSAAELVRLQTESISESQSILQSGAHDLGAKALLTAVDPFLDLVARLMDEQRKLPPAILRRDELSLLKLRIEEVLTLLEDLRIPNSLGHLDLNPWNVIVSENRCVFLDWAEAYVGHPFFSFEYLREHLRREIGANTAFESQLVQAYRAAWTRFLSDEVIRDGLALSPLLAVFAFTVGTDGWKDEERLRDPKIAGYFRSLARRMNREAVRLIEQRSPCRC